MNKELSPLEALEKIKYKLSSSKANGYWEDLDTIEKALKEYESMKQAKIIVVDKKISDDDLEKLKNQRMFVSSAEQCEVKLLFDEETQKKLKALEIIKEKKTFVALLHSCKTVYEYNEHVKWENAFLTKEDFDLLKEVLK